MEKVLKEILAKRTKGNNQADKKAALDALYANFQKEKDFKLLAEYLNQLHISIFQAFLERICITASEEDINSVAKSLVADELFQKGQPSKIMYPRGFPAVLVLASKEKYQAAFIMLSDILSRSEKSGKFSASCLNNFEKLIAKKNGSDAMIKIFEHAEYGSINCTDSTKEQFTRFLNEVGIITANTEQDGELPTTKKQPPKNPSDDTVVNSLVDESKKTTNLVDLHVLEKMEKSQEETLKMLRTISEKCSTLNVLEQMEKSQREILIGLQALTERSITIDPPTKLLTNDAELSTLRADIKQKEQLNVSLLSEIAENKKEIDDLTERLRTALKMDGIAKNQELATLKNDVSEALKLEYANYTKSKERAYNEDLFEAYRAMLSRVFRVLRRHGISCE